MLRKDFYFDLPAELVAQYPPAVRGESRLMALVRASGRVTHSRVEALASFIPRGSLMVFNDTRVRKARVYADCVQPSGKIFPAELLFVEESNQRGEASPPGGVVLSSAACAAESARMPTMNNAASFALQNSKRKNATDGVFSTYPSLAVWKTMCKKARRVQAGARLVFADGREAVVARNDAFDGTEFRQIVFDSPVDEAWFEANGHVPLPPYVKRADESADAERYQTVYAREPGSVAAPTAGLHFTPRILESLSDAGIETAWVTLHVGLGTFLPVRAEHIEDHVMHEERFYVPPETACAVNEAKRAGRNIVAAGTTSARTLEAAWDGAGIACGSGVTDIFIRPGYRFNAVDALFTNFHTPESTLLMLVCAFAGKETIFAAYAEAIKERYRFFSYGDAMLIV